VAAPTIVSSFNAGAPADVTSLSVTLDSSTAIGDLIIVVGYVEPNSEGTAGATFGTMTLPGIMNLTPGFPIESNPTTITTANDHRQHVWYGYATVAGAQTFTFTNSIHLYWGLAGIVVRGGATTGNPFSEISTAVVTSAAAGITASPPVSITLAAANSLVLWGYGDWTGPNPSTPSGFTSASASPTYSGQPGVASAVYAAAGATGTISATRTGNENGMTASLLSLRAPAGGTAQAVTINGTSSISVALTETQPLAVTVLGTGSMSVASSEKISQAVTVAGVGTQSVVASPGSAQAVTVNGVGTIALTSSVKISQATTVNGVGTPSVALTETQPQAVTVAGVGTPSVTAGSTPTQATTVNGVGMITLASSESFAQAVKIAGVGTPSVTAASTGIAQAVTIGGAGTIALSSTETQPQAVTIGGAGTITLLLAEVVATGVTISGHVVLTIAATNPSLPPRDITLISWPRPARFASTPIAPRFTSTPLPARFAATGEVH
jgi:hypothetical protein